MNVCRSGVYAGSLPNNPWLFSSGCNVDTGVRIFKDLKVPCARRCIQHVLLLTSAGKADFVWGIHPLNPPSRRSFGRRRLLIIVTVMVSGVKTMYSLVTHLCHNPPFFVFFNDGTQLVLGRKPCRIVSERIDPRIFVVRLDWSEAVPLRHRSSLLGLAVLKPT